MVLAKAPPPGRGKTRLCPPCTPREAAALADAALADTLDAVPATHGRPARARAGRPPGDWLAPGVEVVAAAGDGLDERLADAFADVGGPALLVGMDTPQVTPAELARGLVRLMRAGDRRGARPRDRRRLLGIGSRVPQPGAFLGVPMSAGGRAAPSSRGCASSDCASPALPALRDVDHIADARAVAASGTGRALRPPPRRWR